MKELHKYIVIQIQETNRIKSKKRVQDTKSYYTCTYIFKNYRITIFAITLKYPYQYFGLKWFCSCQIFFDADHGLQRISGITMTCS